MHDGPSYDDLCHAADLERKRIREEPDPPPPMTSDEREQCESLLHMDMTDDALPVVRRIAALEAEFAEARTEALALLTAMHPDCEPLDSVAGIVTQINNGVAGLEAENAKLRAVALAAEDLVDNIERGAWDDVEPTPTRAALQQEQGGSDE